jgi:hypothetical protein
VVLGSECLLQIQHAIISAKISSVHMLSASLAIAGRKVSHAVVIAVIQPNIGGSLGKLSGLDAPHLIPNRNLKVAGATLELSSTEPISQTQRGRADGCPLNERQPIGIGCAGLGCLGKNACFFSFFGYSFLNIPP